DHLVISLEAQIATDAAASFARSESTVVRDDDHDRQLMANRGVHLHPVPAECAVSAEHHHREVRTRHLRSDSERDANAHASVRAGVEAASRLIDRNRLRGELYSL